MKTKLLAGLLILVMTLNGCAFTKNVGKGLVTGAATGIIPCLIMEKEGPEGLLISGFPILGHWGLSVYLLIATPPIGLIYLGANAAACGILSGMLNEI